MPQLLQIEANRNFSKIEILTLIHLITLKLVIIGPINREKILTSLHTDHKLKHLAIIPDGNTRWAKANNYSAYFGYRKGIRRGLELTRITRQLGIHTTTFWGLSTENWLRRPKLELDFLIRIFIQTMDEWLHEAQEDDVRIIHLGDKTRLPKKLLQKLHEVETATKDNATFILNLALDYGGRDEITRAAKRLFDSGNIGSLEDYLDTAGQPFPNPDLIIRTSGEMRLSGLMPWQAVYAELYFEPALFPDFTPELLKSAVDEYTRRNRRFGGGH